LDNYLKEKMTEWLQLLDCFSYIMLIIGYSGSMHLRITIITTANPVLTTKYEIRFKATNKK
jgi:hypothetical protein